MKRHRDHIWPRAEGGPDEEWNIRSIPAADNLHKGAEMPDLDDVFDSSDPVGLAVEIDKHSLDGFKHPRNKDKGFGGLRRR
jgi:hypothetical protein